MGSGCLSVLQIITLQIVAHNESESVEVVDGCNTTNGSSTCIARWQR